MTRHCHHCGWQYTLAGQPGRTESCHQCGSDLKVCLNCLHYDTRAAYQCREKRADPVAEKHLANYCEYFEFIRRTWSPRTETNSREESARENLRKLLGD
jgi:ribosome-binding protein aMBF1 (putative translation factor)